jgi:hypothetical protein
MDDHPPASEKDSNKTFKDLEKDHGLEVDRGALAHDWISQAENIAEKTHHHEAMAVMEFLKDRAVPAEPIRGGFRAAAEHVSDEAIYILPLIASDTLIDEHYKHDVEDTSRAATYLTEYRILQLNESVATSPLWKGILTLHEGRHAKEHVSRQYDVHDPELFSAEERDTFIFQGEVMALIGGEAYQDALETKLKHLEENLVEEEGGRIKFPSTGPYDSLLDEAFGPALSEHERQARQTALWIDAVFQLFDQHYGIESSAVEKMLFMKHLYKK